jgi:hypothetical protein
MGARTRVSAGPTRESAERIHAALGDARVARLAADLFSGAWDAQHGHLRERRDFDGSLRLVISEPA